MLKVFIYDDVKDKWIEETQILLFHDLAAVFDDEKKSVFIWKGNNIKQAKSQKGMKKLELLLSEIKVAKWSIIKAENKFPTIIKQKIDEMLKATKQRKQEEKLKFTHFLTIRLSFIFLLVIVIFTIITLINLISVLFYPRINGAVQITASKYTLWLTLYQIFTIIELIFLTCNLIMSIYEGDLELFIFSLISIIVNIGIILYIRYGIFLFLHQTGSTFSLYLIAINDLTLYILLNLVAILIVFSSTSFKLFKFALTYWDYIFISSKSGVDLGVGGS